MFYSRYLPVNIKRKNAGVYTENGFFPAELLQMAETALTNREKASPEVIVEDGVVTFVNNPEYKWSTPDVYLACESLRIAQQENFSFYIVANKEDIPQLFVSKAFKQHRILVNAMNFRTCLVTKPNLIKRVAAMIDGKYDESYCYDVFDVIDHIERGNSRYLDAIICQRDTEDEAMIVNPVTTLYAEDNFIYSKDVIEEYRRLLENPEAETEYVKIEQDLFVRKNVTGYQPVTPAFAKSIVQLYDKLLEKKNNYLYVNGDDYEVYLYISTNWRYLVNARTLECIVLQNSNVSKLVQSYITDGSTPVSKLKLCWMLASEEMYRHEKQ